MEFAGITIVIPSWQTMVISLAVGIVIGAFLFSFHESCVHEYLGHAKKPMRNLWRRHPRIFLSLIEGFFLHHIVHHGKCFREGYLKMFGQSLHMAKVNEWAPEAFYRLFDPRDQAFVRGKLPPATILEHLRKADYGLGAVSGLDFASTIFPLTLVVFLIFPFWVALGASLPMLFVYPAMSNTIHRNIMHRNQAHPVTIYPRKPVHWLWGTAYMKALERWHWMHHEYIYCNFNLFVWADFLRRRRRKPSAQDLEKMASEGLSMDSWSGLIFLRKLFIRA